MEGFLKLVSLTDIAGFHISVVCCVRIFSKARFAHPDVVVLQSLNGRAKEGIDAPVA